MYDDPSVPVREYFIQFTKPSTYPPIVVKQAPGTQNSSNQLPIANAGFDAVVVLPQNETVLEGSGTDSDGTIKSYTWTKDSGSGTIYAPTSAKTTVTGLKEGTSVFRLLVKDNKGAVSFDTVTIIVSAKPTTPSTPITPAAVGTFTPDKTAANQCNNGKDDQIGDGKDYGLGVNNGDGKADFTGVDTNNDGVLDLEPDPSCFSKTSTVEVSDDLARDTKGGLLSVIPCTDKCTFGDVFKLLNNIFTFFFTKLLIPIFVIMIIYAGISYLGSQVSGMKKVELKSLFGHMIGGLLLILFAWLIVHTILVLLGYQEGLVFFQQ
jgi:hypothetical protein